MFKYNRTVFHIFLQCFDDRGFMLVNRNKMREHQLRKELKRIRSVIIRKYHPEKIILFGSMASGEIKEWSDLDLVIIKKTRKRFIRRLVEIASLTDPAIGVDFLVYTPQEIELAKSEGNQFIQDEILKKGKVIYAE